jgi:hypothetical protein
MVRVGLAVEDESAADTLGVNDELLCRVWPTPDLRRRRLAAWARPARGPEGLATPTRRHRSAGVRQATRPSGAREVLRIINERRATDDGTRYTLEEIMAETLARPE